MPDYESPCRQLCQITCHFSKWKDKGVLAHGSNQLERNKRDTFGCQVDELLKGDGEVAAVGLGGK
jgi:hypothetical protein